MQDNLSTFFDKFKLPIALCLLGIVLIIGGIFAPSLNNPKSKDFPKESLVEGSKMISVDVSGAVNKPGVYQLSSGSRIEEAIAAAGGFKETANGEYISKYLNMAQRLSDGTKVYVPIAGEQASTTQGMTVAGTSTQAKVNINSASQAEIEALPGIGPATASKIISGRPYQQIEELISKKIVGKTLFEKIKDSLVTY